MRPSGEDQDPLGIFCRMTTPFVTRGVRHGKQPNRLSRYGRPPDRSPCLRSSGSTTGSPFTRRLCRVFLMSFERPCSARSRTISNRSRAVSSPGTAPRKGKILRAGRPCGLESTAAERPLSRVLHQGLSDHGKPAELRKGAEMPEQFRRRPSHASPERVAAGNRVLTILLPSQSTPRDPLHS